MEGGSGRTRDALQYKEGHFPTTLALCKTFPRPLTPGEVQCGLAIANLIINLCVFVPASEQGRVLCGEAAVADTKEVGR